MTEIILAHTIFTKHGMRLSSATWILTCSPLDDISTDIVLRKTATRLKRMRSKKPRLYTINKFLSLADDSGLEVFYLNGRPECFLHVMPVQKQQMRMNNQNAGEMRGVARAVGWHSFSTALVGDGMEDMTERICQAQLAKRHANKRIWYDQFLFGWF